jgi:hypothetical protein
MLALSAGSTSNFSEFLPLKLEWEDDDWQVGVGTLPSGISFNTSTRTLEGRPDAVQSGVNVVLYGYDANHVKVGKADVTFDIRELPANSGGMTTMGPRDHYGPVRYVDILCKIHYSRDAMG